MKKAVTAFVVISILASCSSSRKITKNTTTSDVPVADTVVVNEPLLKDLKDSASYAIGIFIVNFYKQQGINNINSAVVATAIDDLLKTDSSLLNDSLANAAMMTYINKIQAEKSKSNVEAGEKFLAENKTRAGVFTTESGLQYEIISAGTGPKPLVTDSVTCHYAGSYITGEVFESSYKYGEPVTFAVGGVIKGWTEGLQLMPKGSKWRFYIPYKLGYGINDYYSIPGGSVLIFEIELLDIPTQR